VAWGVYVSYPAYGNKLSVLRRVAATLERFAVYQPSLFLFPTEDKADV